MTQVFPVGLSGCEIDEVSVDEQQLTIVAHTVNEMASCPMCNCPSHRVHSYYTRSPHDVPFSGYAVQVVLRVRRFRCVNPACPKRTFAETLPNLLKPNARRTVRLEAILRQIGLALGGEPGTRLLPNLGMASSPDTLLRIVRRMPEQACHAPRVLGVDDWAFRKGRTYGTILVDLERHRTIDLLPDRSAETLACWLRQHPGVEVIARDRSKEYARGAGDGAPSALQVADRWHLLDNLRQVVERLISHHHASLNELPPVPRCDTLRDVWAYRAKFPRTRGDTSASEASRARRLALYELIQRLRLEGHSIRQIAKELELARGTVSTFYHASSFPERKPLLVPSILDPYLSYLERRRREGCENARQLWREIREQGYPGTYRQVSKWLRSRRTEPSPNSRKGYMTSSHQTHYDQSGAVPFLPLPSPRRLSSLFLKDPAGLDENQESLLQRIRQHHIIDNAYQLAQVFVSMVRQHLGSALDPWLDDCCNSGIGRFQRFAQSLQQDYSAVRAAIETPWSNGQTEGQVNRLKLIKRQMYGRGNLDLLRLRVLHGP